MAELTREDARALCEGGMMPVSEYVSRYGDEDFLSPSTSYPFMATAKAFGVDYGALLRADEGGEIEPGQIALAVVRAREEEQRRRKAL